MAERFVFCSKCGAQNAAAAAFCQKCGAALNAGVPAAALAAPAAPAAYSPYGGFWIRVAAYLLDNIIVGAVTAPLILIFLLPSIIKIIQAAEANQEPPPELFGAFFLVIPLIFVVQWLYEALMTSSSWQGTVGKRVLRLKVTDMAGNRISFGRATGRFFSKIISRTVMYIGYIMVAFTERKQGLHDMIAGTLVMKY